MDNSGVPSCPKHVPTSGKDEASNLSMTEDIIAVISDEMRVSEAVSQCNVQDKSLMSPCGTEGHSRTNVPA